ncbi:MAG: NADH-quinone oxidoreductase subunit M [Candidatus Methylophosphatis roskildensis]
MLLSTLLLIPLAGAGLILLLRAGALRAVRAVAVLASGATLLLACVLLGLFDPSDSGIQFFESHRWNPRFGTAFSLGLDGISLPLVLLAALLCLVAVLASAVRQGAKAYYLLLLLLEAALLGVFAARDWSLFYVFWELTLIPLFFLIDRHGGANRHRAALNFVLYTMGGSVFMLVALLVLFDAAPSHSFDMATMAQGAVALPAASQIAVFLGLLVGFGVKMPLFPLHGWLPLAHVESPSPVSILLSGILLKMGSYGLIRAAEALPTAVLALQGWLAALALVSLLYGGVLAWTQRDLKAMIAYSSVSHMGVVLLGIAALNVAGITGAVMQMVAHGLVAGALFLLVGQLYERTHTRDIADYGSLARITPRFAFFTVIAFTGAIGLPGTAGFIAELHALIGGFERWGAWVVLLSLGVLVSAAYSVRTIGRLLTGPARPALSRVPDLNVGEAVIATVLCAGTVALGFLPGPLLGLIGASVRALAQKFGT